MKRRISRFALALCLLLQFTAAVMPAAAVETTMEKAIALHDLNLFAGTDQGFELDRAPKRTEGLVMFVRMMGAEADALVEDNSHPFTDVPQWADPYVGYAWAHGLTKGVSATSFGSAQDMTVSEYTTLLLRVLGYSDSVGDFTWDAALEKAVEIQMFTAGQADDLRRDQATRGRMVYISWAALTQPFKGETVYTLARSLVEKGVFTKEQAQYYGLWNESGKPYLVDTLIRANIGSEWHMTMDGTDGLIYYDQGKKAIYRIDLSEGGRREPELLLDTANASFSTKIGGLPAAYKHLEVKQVYADDVNQRLVVVGYFTEFDLDATDGWGNNSAPIHYSGYFIVKNGKCQLLASFIDEYSNNYIFEVQNDGRYIAGDERGQSLNLLDLEAIKETSFPGRVKIISQIGNDIYAVSWYGTFCKYNYSTQDWDTIASASYSATEYSRNGLFYLWGDDRKITAIRPDGMTKVVLDLDTDLEITDAQGLSKSQVLLVTADESFAFYDSNANAIRLIYKNPDA